MSDTEHLRVRDLYKRFDPSHALLSGLDLSVLRGERVALLGRSGSGKSTLLNLIAGIDSIDAGDVSVAGQSLVGMSDNARTLFRRRHIGFVYQSFNLIETLSVAENILLPLQLNGVSAGESASRLNEMLQHVGLCGREQALTDQLSGGEQQRVAIARAMIHQPTLILADEHTGNLDAQTAGQIANLFNELAIALKQSVLMVTHSAAVAASADRVLVIEDGAIVEGDGGFAW